MFNDKILFDNLTHFETDVNVFIDENRKICRVQQCVKYTMVYL